MTIGKTLFEIKVVVHLAVEDWKNTVMRHQQQELELPRCKTVPGMSICAPFYHSEMK